MRQFLLLLILIVTVSSCTMEKRLYNRGWNVQWEKRDFGRNFPSERKEIVKNDLDKQNNNEVRRSVESIVLESNLIVSKPDLIENRIEQDFSPIIRVPKSALQGDRENERVANDISVVKPVEKKEKKEVSHIFWQVLFMSVGVLLIAAAILLFIFAPSTILFSSPVFFIVIGMFLAVLGFCIILGVGLLISTNGMLN